MWTKFSLLTVTTCFCKMDVMRKGSTKVKKMISKKNNYSTIYLSEIQLEGKMNRKLYSVISFPVIVTGRSNKAKQY